MLFLEVAARKLCLLTAALLVASLFSEGAEGAGPSASAALGIIKGSYCDAPTPKIMKFLGIPYAKPPVGGRRFAAPVTYDTKYPSNGLNATNYKPSCMQSGATDASEDCLYINVWTPNTSSTAKLPVRVFIHGGGYQTGSGSEPTYDGCQAASDANTVMVTLNYRLGVLGYLALPELRDSRAGNTTGNWGLLDQRKALQWVQTNIRAFGGDPKKVLLTGQSAGGYSTLLHTLMPGSKGLFAAAAPMSGSTDVMAFDFKKDAYAKGAAVAAALNCSASLSSSTRRSCLLAVPANAIVAAQEALGVLGQPYPAVDGVALPKAPLELLKSGKTAGVPVLFGMNANEGVLEGTGATSGNFSIGKEEFLPALAELQVSVPAKYVSQVYQQYNSTLYGSWFLALTHAITDAGYWCPAYRAASYFANSARSPVRFYIINAVLPTSTCIFRFMTGQDFGAETQAAAEFFDAFHGYDLPLQFLSAQRYNYVCNFTNDEIQLGTFLSGIMTSEAATGQPMPPRSATLTKPSLKSLKWPAWGKHWADQDILNLDVNKPDFMNAGLFMAPRCKIWDDILEYNVKRGSNWDSS